MIGVQAAPGRRQAPLLVLVGLTSIALAFGVVQRPWLVTGIVFGALILWAATTEPLVLVGLMLGLGALDLSFATGGFKALFPNAGGLDMNGIRLVAMTCGLSAMLLAERSVQREALGSCGRWYLLFLLWITASLATSVAPLEGLRLLFKLAYPFLTFVVVAGLVQSRRQLERLMLVTLIAGAAIVIAVNPLFGLGAGFDVDHFGFRRLRGLGGANPFSFYLLVLLLITFGRFVVRGKLLYLALCGLLGFLIVMTLTRIALAACLAGIGAMVLFAALEGRNRRAVVAGALMSFGIGMLFVPQVMKRTFGYVPSLGELVSLARSPVSLYESMNWQGREVLWPILYNAYRGDPNTGLGLGSSGIVVRENFPSIAAQVAHNEYLRLAVDTGRIGIALFFAAMMSWLVWMIKLGWRAPPLVREFALPAVGTIIAWAFISITDNSFDYYAQFTQYVGFLCGGAIAAARLSAAELPEATTLNGPYARFS